MDDVREVEVEREQLRLEPIALGTEGVELRTRPVLRVLPLPQLELDRGPRLVRGVDLALGRDAGASLAVRVGDPAPERREEARGERVAVRGREEVQEVGVHVAADGEDSETEPVREREARIPARELVPEAPDAEIGLADVCVVKQEDPSLAELRQPCLDVVGDRLVAVRAVDVEQVDRAVLELRRRLVERLLEEAREGAVEGIVMCPQVLEDLRSVRARVRVAFPRVDRVAPGLQRERLHGLAERAVRIALPGPELDQCSRPQRSDGEEGEGHVLVPADDVGQPPRLIEDDRVAQWLERAHEVVRIGGRRHV